MRSRKSVPMPAANRCGSGDASTSMPMALDVLWIAPMRSGINATDWELTYREPR